MDPTPAPRPRRRIWPWIVGLILTPFLLLGLLVVNTLRLNAEARLLRDALAPADGTGWHTQVQLNLSPLVLTAVRGVVACLDQVPPEARQAFRAVRSASIGVYELANDARDDADRMSVPEIDAAMTRRGWVRAVGVREEHQQVLVYFPGRGQPSRVCVAVRDGREFVVVAGSFRPDVVADLVGRQLHDHPIRHL